jgi:hypothetical protein
MVIACIALTVALGGTSFAAVTLARNSVGTKQLKKNAVISSKVKNRSLLAADFKCGQLPRGAPGAPGAPGTIGPPGPFPDPLPAGQTVRGNYAIFEHSATAGLYLVNAFSYGFRLTAAPSPHYLNTGAPPTPECPGSVTAPSAAAGHLCVYEAGVSNFTNRRTCDPETAACLFASSNREGLAVAASVTSSGIAYVWGSWAVTAGATTGPSYAGLPRGGAFAK